MSMFEARGPDSPDDLRASMRRFQRSQVGEVAAVEPRHPTRVLLALDGSAQDRSGMALMIYLTGRFGCEAAVVDAREGGTDDDLSDAAADAVGAAALPRTGGDAFEQILRAVDASEADLLIVPSPFGRDLDRVGPDSTGTVIDVLVARSKAAMLVVRRPFDPEGRVFEKVLLVVTGENPAARLAAEWSAGLVAPGGRTELVMVLEEELQETMESLLRTIDPDADVRPEVLTEALARSQARLHRAMKKSADDRDFEHSLQFHIEGEAGLAGLHQQDHPSLLVLPLDRSDELSLGRVANRLRPSPNLALVVPGMP